MRRENRKGKRLLVLMLVLSVVMSFSFSSVLAETEYSTKQGQGSGGSASTQSYPVYIYGQFTDSNNNPVAIVTKENGDVTPTINSSGWVTLGELLNSGLTEAPNRSRYTEKTPYTGDYSSVLNNLNSLSVYSGNNFTVDEIKAASSWALVSSDGANDYVPSGTDTWHLNGQYKVWRLTYDANGGSGTMTDTSGYMNNAPATVKDNQFSKPGYTFIGWSTSANGDVKYQPGDTIKMTEDTTLYARWKEKDGVTVTYDGNGGKTSDSKTTFSRSVTPEIEFSVQENQFTKSGYQFTGWNTKEDGSGKSYAAGAAMSVTENTTLYAQWKEKDGVTVTYDGNGGKTSDSKTTFSKSVTPEIEFSVQENQFTKSGYQFTGWNTKEDGSGKSYAAGAPMSVTKNTTLYAQWKALNYTVTYTDGVDDEEIFQDQTTENLKYGDKTPGFTGDTPTRAGYTFAGWSPEVKTTITGDDTSIVYTAQWTPKSYTVTYTDGVDDEEIFKDQTTDNLKYGDKTPGFTGDTPTRAGYTFAGWSPEVKTTVTGNDTSIVYTAQWKLKNGVNITYNGNGGKTESGDTTLTNSVTPELPFTVALNTFIRKDYVFTGWNTQPDGKGTSYTAGTGTISVKDGNTVLYAQWKDDKNNNGIADDTEAHYTVTYTDGVANEEVFKDQVASNILTGTRTPAFSGTPTRSGYTFAGWTPTVEDTVTKNITYTATWTKNNTPTNPTTPTTPSTPSEEHKVTISPNNGDADITQTVPDGGKAVEPDDLTNDGYKFDGWYTDSEMTKPFDFSQPIKSDVHIYAKWTKTNTPVKPGTSSSKKVSGILLPKVIAKGKHTQTLTWTALKNVDGYFIYTNHCDEGKTKHAFKKVADYKASKSRVYTVKNLKTYHNYKYYVAAYQIKNGKKVVVRNSVTVHSVCGNTSARSTNVKSVKVSKHSVTLKKGKTYKIKATITKVNKKRAFLDATHCGLLRYLTADSKIATVNYSTGTIKAKKAGKTTVYVLGVNGVRDKVTVTVK